MQFETVTKSSPPSSKEKVKKSSNKKGTPKRKSTKTSTPGRKPKSQKDGIEKKLAYESQPVRGKKRSRIAFIDLTDLKEGEEIILSHHSSLPSEEDKVTPKRRKTYSVNSRTPPPAPTKGKDSNERPVRNRSCTDRYQPPIRNVKHRSNPSTQAECMFITFIFFF